MSEEIVGEGASLSEAVADAAGKLGVDTNEVDWDYDRDHFRGGAWTVQVTARTLDPAVLEQRKADQALVDTGRTWVRDLLSWFDNDGAAVRVNRRGDSLTLDILGAEDSRLFIGKEGKNLPALQHLLGKVLSKAGVEQKVTLDVDGYVGQRDAELEDEVRDAIADVLESGESVTLRRMNGYERHVVHSIAKETDGVTSKSVGDGSFKSVEIRPAN